MRGGIGVEKENLGLEVLFKVFAGVCMFGFALVVGFCQDVMDRCRRMLR